MSSSRNEWTVEEFCSELYTESVNPTVLFFTGFNISTINFIKIKINFSHYREQCASVTNFTRVKFWFIKITEWNILRMLAAVLFNQIPCRTSHQYYQLLCHLIFDKCLMTYCIHLMLQMQLRMVRNNNNVDVLVSWCSMKTGAKSNSNKIVFWLKWHQIGTLYESVL
jgi:hypothetical protein